jgi:hypothetical protein
MKGNRKAGQRRRFVFTSQDKISNLAESMIGVSRIDTRTRHQQIVALESAIKLAEVLAEAIEDEELDDLEGEDEIDDEFSACPPCPKCSEEDDEEEDEDEDEDEEDEDGMTSDDIKSIKTESEDVLAKLKSDKITPQDAQKIVMDIVKYLGAALKSFSETEDLAHVGMDEPKEDAKFSVDVDKSKKKLVGQDKPEGQEHSPEVVKGFGKAQVGDKKLDDKQVAPTKVEAPKAYVGDKPVVDKQFKVPGPSLVYSYVGSKLKESRRLDESMYVHNAVIRWGNGDLEGFSASALEAKTAKERALEKAARKAKHLEKIHKDKPEMAKYSVLSSSQFAALSAKEKKSLQDDWKISAKSMDESKEEKASSTTKLQEAVSILNLLNKRSK